MNFFLKSLLEKNIPFLEQRNQSQNGEFQCAKVETEWHIFGHQQLDSREP